MQEPLLAIVAYLLIILRMLIEAVIGYLNYIIADYSSRLLERLAFLRLTRGVARVPLLLICLLSITGRLVALTHRQHDMVILFLGKRLSACGVTLHQDQRVQSLHLALPVLVVAAGQ